MARYFILFSKKDQILLRPWWQEEEHSPDELCWRSSEKGIIFNFSLFIFVLCLVRSSFILFQIDLNRPQIGHRRTSALFLLSLIAWKIHCITNEGFVSWHLREIIDENGTRIARLILLLFFFIFQKNDSQFPPTSSVLATICLPPVWKIDDDEYNVPVLTNNDKIINKQENEPPCCLPDLTYNQRNIRTHICFLDWDWKHWGLYQAMCHPSGCGIDRCRHRFDTINQPK